MTAFDLPSGPEDFELCVKDAIEQNNREKLVECLASHRVVPVKNQWDGTRFGKTIANFERRGNPKPRITEGTRDLMIDALGIEEDRHVERVRTKIKDHPSWGNNA